jgi:hypothetical protein
VKKILQKPISKILVAGVLFYVFYMVNKNKGLLSIPIKEEDMKNYQFNLITIDTVFAGFSFTVLGMLISFASTEMMQQLKETHILTNQCNNIADSIIMFIISSIISLWFIFAMYSNAIYWICDNIEISQLHIKIVEILFTLEIGYLLYGILLFVISVKGMVMLMRKIFEKDIRNGESKAKKFLIAAEMQRKNMNKYKESHHENSTFKSE